ncbi:alpha/beta hydrolase [Kribbella sandramycini]|uniref:Alpha/beta hydrolase n=1 Tax=Kribbella sandramycini TaxID=60450 RepID=A0A7Y4L193_9ACTN|nr:alpha/beta hydrolase [Kribbella sandramycini]MBB6565147.1 pimeloyl-ACP methyl ester carboxylesterase [Kribbella sandramycini]NOL41416.1 alpha/beta hydrolase [Kribbella sandramycini]
MPELVVDGATLVYDVRGELSDRERPVLLMIGTPMGASGFPTLASYFTDRTVVTYDPRGVERSVRTDEGELNPEIHSADLVALIEALDVGPVDIFASSGGAVNGLALLAARPDLVNLLVAHEPPLVGMLPDREVVSAATEDIYQTYQREGLGPGMAKFIAIVGYEGEFPADYSERPAPDPAMFGLPTEDDGSRDDALITQNLRGTTSYAPDFAALADIKDRLVIGVGEESANQLAARAGLAVAERLGLTAVTFPSGHGGFLGDEYGMPGQPAEFAVKLREVLGG